MFSAFWLCVTIPATGDDVTMLFSAFRLCVTVPAALSDGTVKMPGSIRKTSCSTSVIEDDWLKANGLGGLKSGSPKIPIGLAGTMSEKKSQISALSVGSFVSG